MRAQLVWALVGRLGLSTVASLHAAESLDPRVRPGLFLGADPIELPLLQRAQAEPHVARSPLDPDRLLATFQEGRFTSGGAVSCGYSLSTNGGLTWSRSLIPQLGKLSGGKYDRATDPVAAFDMLGNAYLGTLGLIGANNELGVVLLSRSTNSGVTFDPPVEVFRPTNTAIFPDKNWLAINTFPATAFPGRIAVTFTRFLGNLSPLALSSSDDQGATWTSPVFVTPADSRCQGSQPLWQPDGSLVVVYWNFGDLRSLDDDVIECVRSVDGGRTFGPPQLINGAPKYYDAPSVRDGSFLPGASVARGTGEIFVTYQGLDGNRLPRVWVQRSADGGRSWSDPLAISDNIRANPDPLAASPMLSLGESFNPAVDVSPDGRRVVVAYMDSRIQGLPWVDTFAIESLDGGRTWGAGLRVTESTDARLAPRTATGLMLGDYLGVVAPVDDDTPAVVVTMAERGRGIDPFAVRWGVSPGLTFSSWRVARWPFRDILDFQVATAESDADGDGFSLRREYEHGLNPEVAEAVGAAGLNVEREGRDALSVSYSVQTGAVDLTYRLESMGLQGDWRPSGSTASAGVTNGGAFARHLLPTVEATGLFRLRVDRVTP